MSYRKPWCHTCARAFGSQGIANHRKAHLRRGEKCTITLKSGTWTYRPK